MHPSGIPESERQWGLFSHLSSLLGFLGIPLLNIIAPLVMWQIKKDTMPFGSEQAKEALNFQLSMLLYLIISVVLIFIAIGIILVPIVIVFDLVFTIIAAIKANDGVAYRYPLCIRFVS